MNLKDHIRSIKNYPKKGILFRDITTLIKNEKAFVKCIDEIVDRSKKFEFNKIAAIESRGFIMAGAIAYNLDTAFVPLRKPDKLPGETFKVSYTLEYGSTEMHVHKDALDNLQNVLIIDDLLATGGTALAAIELIEKFENKKIVGAGFIINLPELKGDKKLKDKGIKIHSLMEF